jgi:integrase
MMSKVSQRTVNQLLTQKATAKKLVIWDEEIRGFGVTRNPAGAVSFVLNYRVHGKERRYTIGRHPEFTVAMAREEALALRVDIQNGNDPLDDRNQWKSEPTLRDLADAYLVDAQKRKRESSLYDDRRMLQNIILPALGERRLGAIKEADIARLHEAKKSTPYQANRVLALLSTIFNHGMGKKLVTENPAKGITKFHEAKRERWLSVEELQRFREALDSYRDQDAANALRLLIFTGSRASEVLKATWEEFDLERGVWTKPSHHTKQKKQEHVPLSAPTIKLLESMAPSHPSGPLFIGRDGESRRVSLKRPWIQACKAAGLAEEYTVEGAHGPLKRWRPTLRVHDLRHNFASHLVSNGVSLQVVGKLLGHTQASTTMRYAHLQDAPLREAANQFGDIFTKTAKAAKTRKRSA